VCSSDLHPTRNHTVDGIVTTIPRMLSPYVLDFFSSTLQILTSASQRIAPTQRTHKHKRRQSHNNRNSPHRHILLTVQSFARMNCHIDHYQTVHYLLYFQRLVKPRMLPTFNFPDELPSNSLNNRLIFTSGVSPMLSNTLFKTAVIFLFFLVI